MGLLAGSGGGAVVYTGHLNAANAYTYQTSGNGNGYNGNNVTYVYEIRAQYRTQLAPNTFNIWTGEALTGIRSC